MRHRPGRTGWPAILLALAMFGCNSGSDARSCELFQCFWVKVVGPTPAAEISVSDACGGGGKCSERGGCRSVMLCLKSPPPSGPDIICHVTAVSAVGEVVERDVSASSSVSTCRSTYAFPEQPITVAFSPSEDAGVNGDAEDAAEAGAEGGSETSPEDAPE